jgi:hypothetical protein
MIHKQLSVGIQRGVRRLAAFSLVFGLIFAGCDDPTKANTAPTVSGVTVTAAADSVAKGGTVQFSATVAGTNNPAQTVTWSIVTTGLASGTAISNTGLLTVAAAETKTSIEVKATSTVDNTKSGTKTVTITSTGGNTPTVSGVTVTAADSVAKGGTVQFSAAVAGTNNPAQTVTWSIVTTGTASGTTIDSAGLLTVAAAETKTSIEVKATSTVDNSKSGTKTVTITGTVTVSGVTVTAAADSVAKGGTVQFSAAVAGTNNPAQTVTWSIVTTGTASGTAIDSAGLLTVAAAETTTSIEVKATSTVDTSKSGIKTVTITGTGGNTPTVSGVTVTAAADSVAKGGTVQFSAEVWGSNNPAQTVTWSIVTTSTASGTAIDSTGLLTVAAAETTTSIEVKATSTVDTSKSGTKTVTILVPTVNTVNVTAAADGVYPGGTLQFSAEVWGSNNPAQTVIWSINDFFPSNSNLGTTIDSSTGLLTVAAAETMAGIEVKATSTVNPSKSGTKWVDIFHPYVTSVSVTAAADSVAPGRTLQFNTTVEGDHNPAQTVIWSIVTTDINPGTTIDSSTGLLTVAAAETQCYITVKATSDYQPNRSGTKTVTTNGQWVFVARMQDNTNKMDTSTNGTTWTHVANPSFGNNYIASVAYGNGMWVAGGNDGKMDTSTNGTTWTQVANSSFGNYNIRSVAYGNGMWVAVGSGGKIATSTNGTTWSQVADSSFGNNYIASVAYGNGMWVAMGSGKIATSTNGTTWSQVEDSSFDNISFESVACNNGTWVAVGNVGNNGKIATSSTNGITWTLVEDSSFGNTGINSVAYGNGMWVAVGNGGKIATSTNGTTWLQQVADTSFGQIHRVAYGNGMWVAGGNNGNIATSTNGTTWTQVLVFNTTTNGEVVAYNGYNGN